MFCCCSIFFQILCHHLPLSLKIAHLPDTSLLCRMIVSSSLSICLSFCRFCAFKIVCLLYHYNVFLLYTYVCILLLFLLTLLALFLFTSVYSMSVLFFSLAFRTCAFWLKIMCCNVLFNLV